MSTAASAVESSSTEGEGKELLTFGQSARSEPLLMRGTFACKRMADFSCVRYHFPILFLELAELADGYHPIEEESPMRVIIPSTEAVGHLL